MISSTKSSKSLFFRTFARTCRTKPILSSKRKRRPCRCVSGPLVLVTPAQNPTHTSQHFMGFKVLLSVQPAELDSYPNLLRLASLDGQVALALKSITTLPPGTAEAAWSVALNHAKTTNHLRIQKATLDRMNNIIRNVARCMRSSPSSCLDLQDKPQCQ